MKHLRAPLTFLLPLLAFALSTSIILVPTALAYLRMQNAAHGRPAVKFHSNQFSVEIPRAQFGFFAFQAGVAFGGHTVEALNMPGFIPQSLIDAVLTWPREWSPKAMTFSQWRAITLPFFALPFWWFAGRGLEGFLRWRDLRWPTLLLGTLLCAFSLFLLLGLTFGLSATEKEGMVYPLWGFGLWSLLFAVFPVTWAHRYRVRRIEAGAGN